MGIIKISYIVHWILWEVWYLMIVLRYEDGDIRVMLVEYLWLWEILVLRFASPVACTYGNRCVTNLKHDVFLWLSSLWVVVGDKRWSFLPIYPPPRNMRIMLGFWRLVDFCNKYVSSLWLMLSPWIIRTLTLPSLLASSVPCIALSHLESWCKLRRCIQTPWYDTLYHT